MEGGHNGSITRGRSDTSFTARGTFLRWISTAQKEEVSFADREEQLKNLVTAPKTKKNPKDKALDSLIQRHKKNEITTKDLLSEYMVLTNEKALPRNLRHYSSVF